MADTKIRVSSVVTRSHLDLEVGSSNPHNSATFAFLFLLHVCVCFSPFAIKFALDFLEGMRGASERIGFASCLIS